MTVIAETMDSLTLTVRDEIHVRASLETTFDSLLAQVGRLNETPDGKPFPMTLEPWPGGRWFRDLGGDNGHLWGHVQAIKRPTLLEIWGPLFMSFAAVLNLQYRLTPVEGGTLITFVHSAMGLIPEDVRTGMGSGWSYAHARSKRAAQRAARK